MNGGAAKPFDAVLLIAVRTRHRDDPAVPAERDARASDPIRRASRRSRTTTKMGGRSPLNEPTFRQADALRARGSRTTALSAAGPRRHAT